MFTSHTPGAPILFPWGTTLILGRLLPRIYVTLETKWNEMIRCIFLWFQLKKLNVILPHIEMLLKYIPYKTSKIVTICIFALKLRILWIKDLSIYNLHHIKKKKGEVSLSLTFLYSDAFFSGTQWIISFKSLVLKCVCPTHTASSFGGKNVFWNFLEVEFTQCYECPKYHFNTHFYIVHFLFRWILSQ